MFGSSSPPSSIPLRWRRYWEDVYLGSQIYTAIPGYYEEDAALTATVVTRTAAGGCRPRGRTPQLGDLTDLTSPTGRFLYVEYTNERGEIWREDGRVRGRKPPALLWSHTARALVVFPRADIGACRLPPVRESQEVLERWTQGRRGGRCSSEFQPPSGPLPFCAPGVCVAYKSDKFGARGDLVEYVHHFDSAGVRVWMSSGGKGTPKIIVVQGGKLRIETHGVAG